MSKELITKHVVAVILLASIFGYGGFYYGKKTLGPGATGIGGRGQFDRAMFQSGQRGANGQQRPGGGMRGGNFLTGEVLKMDDKSVTIKLNDGGSKTAYFTASTTVDRSVSGTVNDLKNGDKVMVNGKANTDGSVNAEIIQIRPSMLNRELPKK